MAVAWAAPLGSPDYQEMSLVMAKVFNTSEQSPQQAAQTMRGGLDNMVEQGPG